MIFVTGGTGLLGAHLLFLLCKKGFKVKALKRKNASVNVTRHIFEQNAKQEALALFENIEWCAGDLLDYQSLMEATEGTEQVFHTAAKVSFVKSEKDAVMKQNIKGTANVVNACLENSVKHLCYVSSIATLGKNTDSSFINEQSPRTETEIATNYSQSKYEAELEVWRAIAEGLQAVIVNPSIILGAGNWHRSSGSFFTTVWKGMKFYTEGGTGFVDVFDVCKAMIQLSEKGISGERFIISAENRSYLSIFNKIAEALNKKKPHIKANNTMLELAWRYEYLKHLFSKHKPAFTKETARSAVTKSLFSNQKLCETLDFEFNSIDNTIERIAQAFLHDFGK